ncbi:hypothetical protein LCGC14_2587100 [marine sediment metagenome]|uniref:Uncharacterized protein n=1 Tax=marine sediment metagenome TaxID=412755 RepID=A0A0F9ACN9_9ZZZZ
METIVKNQTVETKQTVTPIVKVKPMEMGALLLVNKGSNIVTLHTKTDARLKKTNNPYGIVYKYCTVNGMIGVDYESCCNRQQTRENQESNFQAMPPTWGEHIDGTCLVTHNGKLYLPIMINNVYGPVIYKDSNDKELSKDDIREFLPQKYGQTRQTTEKEVIWRKYLLTSIIAVTMNKVYYKII